MRKFQWAGRRPVCEVPAGSAIAPYLKGSHFHDAHAVAVAQPEHTALQHLLAALSATPPWVDALMALRNRAVALVGLKNLGGLKQRPHFDAGHAYVPGDRIGIFTLVSQTDDEVLVGDDDKHLCVVLSVKRLPPQAGQPARVVLSTVVHVHNLLGHLYMLPVWPAHTFIAPAVLARIGLGADVKAGAKAGPAPLH